MTNAVVTNAVNLLTGGIATAATVNYDTVIQVEILRGRWGVQRKISAEALEVIQSQGKDVRDAIRGISKNLVENCDEYTEILRLDTAIRAYLSTENGVVIHAPWLGRARYLFPIAVYGEAMEVVRTWQRERELAVQAFLCAYATGLVDREKTRLGPLFLREQYPPVAELEFKFWTEVSFPPLDPRQQVDARLQEIDAIAYSQALMNATAKLADCNDQVRYALRKGLLEVSCAMRQALGTVTGSGERAGKPKRLHASIVHKLQTFVDLLSLRNLSGDAELQRIGDQIKRVLEATTLAQLKTDEVMREDVRKTLDEAARSLQQLVGFQPETKKAAD